MRDKKRIDRILRLLKRIWCKYPDVRLLQLLSDTMPNSETWYYMEDDILEDFLTKMYLTNKAKNDKIRS